MRLVNFVKCDRNSVVISVTSCKKQYVGKCPMIRMLESEL